MGQLLNTSEVQAVISVSELLGDLASDFIETKTEFFDVSCHIVWSLVFIVNFADNSKN